MPHDCITLTAKQRPIPPPPTSQQTPASKAIHMAAMPTSGDSQTPCSLNDQSLEDLSWAEQKGMWQEEEKQEGCDMGVFLPRSQGEDREDVWPVNSEDERIAALIKDSPTAPEPSPNPHLFMMSGALDDDDARCSLPSKQCVIAKRKLLVLENPSQDSKVHDSDALEGDKENCRPAPPLHLSQIRPGGCGAADNDSKEATLSIQPVVGKDEGTEDASGWHMVGDSDSDESDDREDGGNSEFGDNRFDPDVRYNVATRFGWL